MTRYTTSIDRDANRQVIDAPLPFKAYKRMTFDGGTTNDPGDVDGTGNPATLFTVTGDVLISIFGVVKQQVTGDTATISIGNVDSADSIIATFTATQLNPAGISFLYDNYSSTAGGEAVAGWAKRLPVPVIIGNGKDIIQTVGTADVTAGIVDYYCFWRPLSSDGKVVAA